MAEQLKNQPEPKRRIGLTKEQILPFIGITAIVALLNFAALSTIADKGLPNEMFLAGLTLLEDSMYAFITLLAFGVIDPKEIEKRLP